MIHRFSAKLLLSVLVPLVLVFLTLGGYMAWRIRLDSSRRVDQKGETINKLLSMISVTPLLAYDFQSLEDYVQETLRDEEVAFLVIYDSAHRPVTHSSVRPAQVDADGVKVFTASIQREGQSIGQVEVGVTLQGLRDAQRQDVLAFALITLLTFGLALALAILLSRQMTTRLARLSEAAGEVTRGNLQCNLEVGGDDEVGDLARSFEMMTGALAALLKDLGSTAAQIDEKVGLLHSTVSQQTKITQAQASHLPEASASAEQVATNSRNAARGADSVIVVACRSEELSRVGRSAAEKNAVEMAGLEGQVATIAHSITDLAACMTEIGVAFATAKEIAEQTNLLALNASMEAAKAHEYGRGFGVVAAEMRHLADQSKGSADQVRRLLPQVEKAARHAAEVTDEGCRRAHDAMVLAKSTGETIVGLEEIIRESSGAARQIALDTRQQAAGIEQIVRMISEFAAAMQVTSGEVQQVEQVASSLKDLSGRLRERMRTYQV
ncbi:MAG: methyl-accepting chemotaxis protein [Deltaproteobacteria bacterium]|nr:methyl-accepting chemotaxis protein [Deltaproteobacteria bacterium]